MAFRFDWAGLGEHHTPVLVIEAKSRLGTDVAWARELRRLITEHAPIASSALLVVTPDRLYLWPAGATEDATPVDLEARTTLGPYFERAGVPLDRRVDPHVFERLVGWWLHDLTTQIAKPPPGLGLDPALASVRELTSEWAA